MAFLLQNRKVKVIFDAGANIGFVTYQFLKRFPEAEIYAFEPNPAVFSQLESSYENDIHVHCHQQGVADVSGSLEFNLNANSGTSSFLNPTTYHQSHQARRKLEPIVVPITTIDEFSAKEMIDHIDILKLDIEGYELKALVGADKLLNEQKIDLIYLEVCLIRQYNDQPLFHEISSYLERKKYYVYNIDSFIGQETPIRQAVIGNAVFISHSFRNYLVEEHGLENCGW